MLTMNLLVQFAGHQRTDGSLCRRSCTTEEIGNFANKFLKTGGESAISSHSFKHTTLAWCSAYGLDEPSRTLLGHHELQGAKAMAVYSRDMLTRPLQLYCSMLANIRQDHFRPDESRTSRMVDLMKIADNAAAPVEKQAGAPACNQPLVKFVMMGTHPVSQQRLWNKRLKGQMQLRWQTMIPVRYLRLARARAVVRMAMTCQLHRTIFQVQFGGIGVVTWCTGVHSQQVPPRVAGW